MIVRLLVTFSLAAALSLSGCLIIGIRTAPEPTYSLSVKEGNKEIRRYGSVVVAQTSLDGPLGEESNAAFMRLFRYIGGANRSGASIAMTAPVLQSTDSSQATGEKISMTAPVIQTKTGNDWIMSFVLPNSYTQLTAPQPTDSAVTISELPARSAAVIRYSGASTTDKMDSFAAELQDWASKNGIKLVGEPQLALYDPPFTIPFLRRNEVHFDVAD